MLPRMGKPAGVGRRNGERFRKTGAEAAHILFANADASEQTEFEKSILTNYA